MKANTPPPTLTPPRYNTLQNCRTVEAARPAPVSTGDELGPVGECGEGGEGDEGDEGDESDEIDEGDGHDGRDGRDGRGTGAPGVTQQGQQLVRAPRKNFTPGEDEAIRREKDEGKRWADIARLLRGRTPCSVRKRWARLDAWDKSPRMSVDARRQSEPDLEPGPTALVWEVPSRRPTISEMCDYLRHELALGDEAHNIPTTVDAACRELGVSDEGSLVEKATRCCHTLSGGKSL